MTSPKWCCGTMTDALALSDILGTTQITPAGTRALIVRDGTVLLQLFNGVESPPLNRCPWCGHPPKKKRQPTAARPWERGIRASADDGATLAYWAPGEHHDYGGWWCRTSPDDPIEWQGVETGSTAETLIDAWLTRHGITLQEGVPDVPAQENVPGHERT